jgi:hypothetical protein
MEKRGYTYAEAMSYLSRKRKAFEKHTRPRLPPPTSCGTGRVFEREDLDRAWEEYCNARRAGRLEKSTSHERQGR